MANITATELRKLDTILEKFPDTQSSDLIPILQQVQAAYGYLQKDILFEVSKKTSIPASRIYGVATFYEQFHFEPHGKHTIKCCRGTACHVKGATELAETIEKYLGIKDGQTTDDMMFTFETVACLGTCAIAPVMMIDDTYYGKMTPKKTEEIIDELKAAQEAS